MRSGKGTGISITWALGILSGFFALIPLIHFIMTYGSGPQLYDYSRGDIFLGVAMLLLSLFGVILLLEAFGIRIDAELVEYGLEDVLTLKRAVYLFAGIVLMIDLTVVLYYVINGFVEVFLLFSTLGLIMSTFYMIGLVSIRKEGSVKQVYDIPWWREFDNVIKEFNRTYEIHLHSLIK